MKIINLMEKKIGCGKSPFVGKELELLSLSEKTFGRKY